MKAFIKANQTHISQGGLDLYFFEQTSEIPTMGLTIKTKHKFEEDNILDNLNEYLINVIEDRLVTEKIYYEKDGKMVPISKYQLATYVMKAITEAAERVSKDGKNVFVSYIDEAKDKVKEYLQKNEAQIEKAKEIQAIVPTPVAAPVEDKTNEIDYEKLARMVAMNMGNVKETNVIPLTVGTGTVPQPIPAEVAKIPHDKDLDKEAKDTARKLKRQMGGVAVDVYKIDPKQVSIQPLRQRNKGQK